MSRVWFLLVFGLALNLSLPAVHGNIYHSIARGLKERAKHQAEKEESKEDEVPLCYPNYGCYIKLSLQNKCKDHPQLLCTTNFEHFPKSPEELDVKFLTFTSPHQQVGVEMFPDEHESFEPINKLRKIVFIIHGLLDKYDEPRFLKIKTSLLSYTGGEVGTVIMVDWHKGSYFGYDTSKLSKDNVREGVKLYDQAAANTQIVGRMTAYLIDKLKQKIGIEPETDVHLIGFSLGAQASGFAGKWSKQQYSWTIGRITGLDAAGPWFIDQNGFSALSSDDAMFVDAIHTTTFPLDLNQTESIGAISNGQLGYPTPYGHLDFYVNNALSQPMCPEPPSMETTTCKHGASIEYFEASLRLDRSKCTFNGYSCPDWQSYQSETCHVIADSEMGYWSLRDSDPSATGIRYLATVKDGNFCKN